MEVRKCSSYSQVKKFKFQLNIMHKGNSKIRVAKKRSSNTSMSTNTKH